MVKPFKVGDKIRVANWYFRLVISNPAHNPHFTKDLKKSKGVGTITRLIAGDTFLVRFKGCLEEWMMENHTIKRYTKIKKKRIKW